MTDGSADAAREPRIDAALRRLSELDSLEVAAHPAIYDQIQRSLAAVLDNETLPVEQ
jgi:hypothetical protein